jgi:chemotaxis protein CheY-P-specific phosphatase CheC
MKFTKELLQKVADEGGKEVSRAFSKLSKEEVTVETAIVDIVSYDFIIKSLEEGHDHAVITYAQTITGVDGVSLLLMSREAALVLVDVLNQQEIGTTGVLMDLDKSAVKETLNILSNSYLNYLSKNVDANLMFGEPYMMTVSNVENVVSNLRDKNIREDDGVLVFKTVLKIAKHQINAQLYVLFNKKIVELIKNIK